LGFDPIWVEKSQKTGKNPKKTARILDFFSFRVNFFVQQPMADKSAVLSTLIRMSHPLTPFGV